MLQNDFFSFSAPQIKDNTVNATLELNALHAIFEGHFPDHPIVPGVCMMQMLKEVVEHVTGKETNLLKADNIKFLTILDPQENKSVQLEYTFTVPEKNKISIDARLFNTAAVFFKFKGTFVM